MAVFLLTLFFRVPGAIKKTACFGRGGVLVRYYALLEIFVRAARVGWVLRHVYLTGVAKEGRLP